MKALPLFLVTLVSFQSITAHASIRLSSITKELHKKLNHLQLKQCEKLETSYEHLFQLDYSKIDRSDLAKNHTKIEKEAFLARVDLRHKMRAWEKQDTTIPDSCVKGLRDMFRALRYLEETVAVIGTNPEPFDENNVAPYLSGKAPYLQINPAYGNLQFPRDLKSGDLLVSRGNAPTSALIARLGDTDGQFSHVAMVYIHPTTHQVLMMEEHIEVGSAIRPYEVYAADHNFRVTVYRHHDSQLAANAAQVIYNRFYSPSKEHVVPYDFKMVMDDPRELFCSEVAYEGFKEASNGSVLLGKYRTQFHPKNRSLLNRFGIKTESMFAPSDVEMEPNFEVLGEWRDVSRVISNQMMDAILTKLLAWGDDGYVFTPTTVMKIKADLGHLLRLMGFKKKELPTNMPISVISTVFALDPTVNALLGALSKENESVKSLTGYNMTFENMFKKLEELRQEDLQAYENGEKNILFHSYFHIKQ